MPYLGKDWRSNGEKWIRTDQGWERCKALESILNHLNIEYRSDAVRKAENKKSKNDTRFYLFDELEASGCDIDLGEPEPRDGIEISNSTPVNKQPCIYLHEKKSTDRKNNAPKLSVSEVLNGLDMPGAVSDSKRFNYVYQLMKIIIEEKLNLLSGNGQRALFMIIKVMIIQALRSNENTNLVRKLLVTLKKKIQESIFFYFHYIGSQKLCESHLDKISKWQELLDNATKRDKFRNIKENMGSNYFEAMPHDCKLEILRRLNSGLDIVNMSMVNKSLNQAISNEILVWKNLCQFHFNQSQINHHVTRLRRQNGDSENTSQPTELIDSLDWKLIYFKLTKRYGRKEVYADMVNKCMSCKCMFWKEMGHPCRYGLNSSSQDSLLYETRYEPVTPRKLIDLLFI